jgi:phage terminase large subunit
MDKSSKILSSEYDMIYCQEATEITEEDWETLLTRNRFGVMPYQQVIADCNPNHPRHWLKRMVDEGKINYLFSRHEDNPMLYDQQTKSWTKRGLTYLRTLDGLTGVRRKRYFEGIWSAAEGMIYDAWDDENFLIQDFKVSPDFPRFWVVDFGFVNPFVWQCWAYDEGKDILYLIKELYMTRILVEDACALISRWKRSEDEPDPVALICDWDAEGRGTLERHLDLESVPASKGILDGIENVKSRMKLRDDGKRGMYIVRDIGLETDLDLREFGKPTSTAEEFPAYEWEDKKVKDEPKKLSYDHGMDCTRYICTYLDEEYSSWVSGGSG